jgi:hypothetical protein
MSLPRTRLLLYLFRFLPLTHDLLRHQNYATRTVDVPYPELGDLNKMDVIPKTSVPASSSSSSGKPKKLPVVTYDIATGE